MMGFQWPLTHYPNRFERQAVRAQGYLRRCVRCGLHKPLLGGKPSKRGFRCKDCRTKALVRQRR
jgi:DNA-directed RNA polymerase subunit RPC12/RpoP